jgi:pyruvate formate lyase activating enzyme
MTGIVTDIQRFSIHDGPGIRTTVFLKGCNMCCRWCHNPETIGPRPQIQLFPDKCIGCGACLEACTRGAHVQAGGAKEFRRELCLACGQCAKTCYAEAIVLVGKDMTAGEVVAEVMQDREFYKNSGGGVTVSGGEPLFQVEFTHEILRLCRERGLHTAVESNMAWPWKRVTPILPLTDLVIVDIKLMNGEAHREWTGLPNDTVLANAERLSRQKVDLIVRTPVIPGVNDTPEEIDRIAAFIAPFENLLYYELLPFHPMGTGKYRSLGMEWKMGDLKRPANEQVLALAAVARRRGITVKPEEET